MSKQRPRSHGQQTSKKSYQKPTASKTRLENIVAGTGSCNYDLTGLRDNNCYGPPG